MEIKYPGVYEKLPIEVSLDPIIAGKKGVKLKAVTKSFLFSK